MWELKTSGKRPAYAGQHPAVYVPSSLGEPWANLATYSSSNCVKHAAHAAKFLPLDPQVLDSFAVHTSLGAWINTSTNFDVDKVTR